MIEQFAGQVHENCKDKYGIDIISILAIVEVILGIVDDCFEDENEFVQACQQPTNLQRAVINIRIRRELGIRRRAQRDKVAAEIFGQCSQMSGEQLAGAYQEAVAAINPVEYIDYDFTPEAAE